MTLSRVYILLVGAENIDGDEEYVPPEMEKKKRKRKPSEKVQQKLTAKMIKQQQQASKKSTKLSKKLLSRPANKNVTRGGKVVGKTTKGIKKTGEAAKETARQGRIKACPCCTGKLLKITGPIVSPSRSSEPVSAVVVNHLLCV